MPEVATGEAVVVRGEEAVSMKGDKRSRIMIMTGDSGGREKLWGGGRLVV